MKTIPRLDRIAGAVDVPPSLHFTLGALAGAAHSPGTTAITGGLDSDPVRYVIEALRRLGFEISGSPAGEIVVGDRVSMSAADVELDAGDAPITLRLLAAMLSFTPGRAIVKGTDAVLREDVSVLVENLRGLGAEIEYVGDESHPPLQIRGKIVRGQRAVLGEALALAGFPLPDASSHIAVPADTFIAASWRALSQRLGGTLELRGFEGEPSLPPPAARDEIERVIGEAIAALASGGSIEGDRLVARTVPRFWRSFDAVVTLSTEGAEGLR